MDGVAFITKHLQTYQVETFWNYIADHTAEFEADQRSQLMYAFCDLVDNSCCPTGGLSCGDPYELPYQECAGGRCPDYEDPSIFWYPNEKFLNMSKWFNKEALLKALDGVELVPGKIVGSASTLSTQTSSVQAVELTASPETASAPQEILECNESDTLSLSSAEALLSSPASGGFVANASGGGGGSLCGGGANMCASIRGAYEYFCPYSISESCSHLEYPMCGVMCTLKHQLDRLPHQETEAPASLAGQDATFWVCPNTTGLPAGGDNLQSPWSGCTATVLSRWPYFAAQVAGWHDRQYFDAENKPRHRLEPFVGKSLYAPMSDVNADGKPDLVLLKNTAAADTDFLGQTAVTQYFTRVYLNQSTQTPAFLLDDTFPSRQFDFSRSLLSILANGLDDGCWGVNSCLPYLPYPKNENFNTLLLDVNSDGLPDLVNARRIDKQDPQYPCVPGHEVHLNTGFGWDRLDGVDDWASPDLNNAGTWDDHPLLQLHNWQPMRPTRLGLGIDTSPTNFCLNHENLPIGGGVDFDGKPVETQSMAPVDLNADGRLDFVFAPGRPNPVGSSFESHTRVFLGGNRGYALLDHTRYTFPEITIYALDGLAPRTAPFMLSLQDFLAAEEKMIPAGQKVIVGEMARFADVDGDNLVDIVVPGRCEPIEFEDIDSSGNVSSTCAPAMWHRNLGEVPDLLKVVSSTGNNLTTINYAAATSREAERTGLVTRDCENDPVHCRSPKPVGHMVVSQITRSANGTAPETTEVITARYMNWRRSAQYNEALGFERVDLTFASSADPTLAAYSYQRTEYAAESPDNENALKGHVLRTIASDSPIDATTSASWTYEDTYSYRVEPLGEAFQVRTESSTSSECNDGVCLKHGNTSSNFDAYGNARQIVSGLLDSSGQYVVDATYLQTTLAFKNDTTLWAIGLTERETTTGQTADINGVWRTTTLSDKGFAWDPLGRMQQATRYAIGATACRDSANSDSTEYTFDPVWGLPQTTRYTDGAGTTRRAITTLYDSYGLCTSTRSTSVTSYINGAPSGTTTLSTSSTCDYRNHLPLTDTDLNGNIRSWAYDSYGRAKWEYGPDGSILRGYLYIDSGPLEVQVGTLPGSGLPTLYTRTITDGAGHVLASTRWSSDTTPVRTSFNTYDGWGRVRQSYKPAFLGFADPQTATVGQLAPGTGERAVETSYDSFDRVLTRLVPRSEGDGTWHYSYDVGRSFKTSPTNATTIRSTDYRGRLTDIKRGSTNQFQIYTGISEHEIEYDALGRLLAVSGVKQINNPFPTTQVLSVRRIERDGAGRVHKLTLPRAQSSSVQSEFRYCYDRDDQPTEIATAENRRVTFTRDELSRPVMVVAQSRTAGDVPSATTTYSYDSSPGGKGRLATVSNDVGTQYYEYDAWGRANFARLTITSSTLDALGGSLPLQYSAASQYSRVGRLNQVTYAANSVTLGTYTYQRDAAGRAETLTGPNDTLVTNVLYTATDQPNRIDFGTGAYTEWDFDPIDNELQGITHGGASTYAQLQYGYYPDGNLATEDRMPFGGHKSYTYDGAGRLRSAGIWGNTENYDFDADGNMTQAGASTYSNTSRRHAQAVTQVQTGTSTRRLTYGDDGLMATDVAQSRTRSFSYDGTHCLRSIQETNASGATNASSQFWCDASGKTQLRITHNLANGSYERVLYAPGGLEVRKDEAGGPTALVRISAGGATQIEDARFLSNGSQNLARSGYLHKDLRGSLVAKSTGGHGASAEVVDADYDAWGNMLATGSALPTPDAHAFVDSEPDMVHGLYHFGHRTYDPTLRRWMSPDAYVFRDPREALLDPGLSGSGSQLNLYSYAGNNPTRQVDPGGQFVPFILPWVTGGSSAVGPALAYTGTAIAGTAALGYVAANSKRVTNGLEKAGGWLSGLDMPDSPSGTPDSIVIQNAETPDHPASEPGVPDNAIGPAPEDTSSDKGADRLPHVGNGPGSVPADERDPKRYFTPNERDTKRKEQDNKCANCDKEIDAKSSRGHHMERHADGGRTESKNHAEVCIDCHKRLHQ